MNGLVVCGFTDRFIRLYDTRIQGLFYYLLIIYIYLIKFIL